MKDFYLVIKAKVENGQYRLDDMIGDLQLAYEKSRITLEQHEELMELAKVKVDMNYTGNRFATTYDLEQDIILSDHDLSIVDLYEMVLISATAAQRAKMVMGRSIADSYARLIIKGTRTFDSVPDAIEQDVANVLIEMGRADLVTDEKYLSQEEVDTGFTRPM